MSRLSIFHIQVHLSPSLQVPQDETEMLADQPDGLISFRAHRENGFSSFFSPFSHAVSLRQAHFFLTSGTKSLEGTSSAPGLVRRSQLAALFSSRSSSVLHDAVHAMFYMVGYSVLHLHSCCPARTLAHTDPAVHLMQSASMDPSVTVCVAYATHVPADKPARETAVNLVAGGQAEMYIAEAP